MSFLTLSPFFLALSLLAQATPPVLTDDPSSEFQDPSSVDTNVTPNQPQPVASPSTSTPGAAAQPQEPAEPAMTTNSGDAFVDPFASSPAPESAPSTVQQPPAETPQASDAPVMNPSDASQPSVVPDEPQQTPLSVTPPRNDNFQFPAVEKLEGPISPEVYQGEQNRGLTSIGAWSIHSKLGGGFNFNRRPNQFHLELGLAYRMWKNWELGALLSYRFKDDKLLGFLGVVRWQQRMTSLNSIRVDLAFQGGLGWTLRSDLGKKKFEEGRLTLRGDVEGLWYMMPSLALVASVGVETFVLSVGADGRRRDIWTGGPPTQTLVLVGARYEF